MWASFQKHERRRKKEVRGRKSYGSQPPAGSVDQLQDCSLSGAVSGWVEGRKKENWGKEVTQTSARERGGL